MTRRSRPMLALLAMLLCVVASGNTAFAAKGSDPIAVPLERAHAHNDYEHPRPLLDALDHGFTSVEADIFLVGGDLLIGHDPEDLVAGRTLQSLYLDPLVERARANGGSVFGDDTPFTLLIDLKTDAVPTYEALDRVLRRYKRNDHGDDHGRDHHNNGGRGPTPPQLNGTTNDHGVHQLEGNSLALELDDFYRAHVRSGRRREIRHRGDDQRRRCSPHLHGRLPRDR